jgi:hypothetical protein
MTMSSVHDGFGARVGALLPFPSGLAELFGEVFVPVFTPLDLLNDRLFQYPSCDRPPAGQMRPPPTFLFVLSPKTYVKAESGGQQATEVGQFSTDGRRANGQDSTAALELTRRYIVIGTAKNEAAALSRELTRLLDDAVRQMPASCDEGYVMAIFGNQTSLEVRRHIAIDGRALGDSRPRLESWGDVVESELLPLLVEPAFPSSQPTLNVSRVLNGSSGLPERRITIRFFVADRQVLSTVRIGEGDNFAHARVSKSLR